MAYQQVHYRLPAELDARDPDFTQQCFLRAARTQRDIAELVAGSKNMIAESWALLAEINQILAHK